jgi:hypothetical protein
MAVEVTVTMSVPSVEHAQVTRVIDIEDIPPIADRIRIVIGLVVMSPAQVVVGKQIKLHCQCLSRVSTANTAHHGGFTFSVN